MGAAQKLTMNLWNEEGLWDDEVFRQEVIPRKNVIENRLFVVGALAKIRDEKKIIDEKFTRLGIDILNIIDNERLRQGIEIYTSDQKIILLNELYRVREKYSAKKPRNDGRDVFYSHIMGALRIMVQAEGTTGLASVLAVINHDVLEDFISDAAIQAVEKKASDDIELYLKFLTKPHPETFSEMSLNEVVRFLTSLEATLPQDVIRRLRIMAGRDPEKPIAELIEESPDGSRQDLHMEGAFLKYSKIAAKKIAAKERATREWFLAQDLIDWDVYKDQLTGFVQAYAERIEEKVREIDIGVTKIREPEYEDTLNATLIHTIEVMRRNIGAALVKLADNFHNAFTYDGHKTKEGLPDLAKIRKKVLETAEIYLQMARSLHLRFIIKGMVDRCLYYLNPKLRDDYKALSESRVAEWRDKPCCKADRQQTCWDYVQERLIGIRGRLKKVHANIVDFKMVPTTIDNYTSEVDLSLEEMTLPDLKIPDGDSMFEIVVLVKPGTKQGRDEDTRRAAIREAVLLIEKEFGEGSGVQRDVIERDDSDLDRYLGSPVEVTNSKLGGTIKFRVNDQTFEARSKRGVRADYSEKTPQHVEELLSDVLNRVRKVKDAKTIAGKEFLRPRVKVYTPTAQPYEFSRGATGLDFANRVYTDLLLGLQKLHIESKNVDGSLTQTEVDPLAPLQRGRRYRVTSSIPLVEFDEETYHLVDGKLFLRRKKQGNIVIDAPISLDPGWLAFSYSSTRAEIRRFLHSLGDKDRGYEINEEMGRRYFSRLASIYGVDEGMIIARIEKAFAMQLKKLKGEKYNYGDAALYVAIGRGEIDPLELIIKFASKQQELLGRNLTEGVFQPSDPKAYPLNDPLRPGVVWDVEFCVPEQAGGLEEFSRRFSKEIGIKISRILDHIPGVDGQPGRLVYRFDLDDAKIDIEEFFNHLLRISYTYGVSILSNDLIKKMERVKKPLEGQLAFVFRPGFKTGAPDRS